jgi:integrase
MASSGPRVDAIRQVRIKDLEPIDKYSIYKITYYPLSKNDRYYSFCTPEARSAIDHYLEHRRKWGERLLPEAPLFRTDWSPAATVHTVRPISTDRVRCIINDICRSTGLRGIPTELNTAKRFHIMTNHGLRKFFETNAYRAGMSEPYVDKLMGHHDGSKKVRDAYLKIEEEELLEGDSKYWFRWDN